MEKFNLSMQQIDRLPPGFRFHPYDDELLLHYLQPKVFGCSQPASIIFDCDLSKNDPWTLPGDPKKERYFFNLREAKYKNGRRRNRAAASGYWKATGRDKEIASSKYGDKIMGMKKVLVFYHGKPPTGTRTDWIMHEYRLAGAAEVAGTCRCPLMKKSSSPHSYEEQARDDWVLCRIFKKRRASRREDDNGTESEDKMPAGTNGIRFIDFMGQDRRPVSPSFSSSDSSCVTDSSEGFMDSSMC